MQRRGAAVLRLAAPRRLAAEEGRERALFEDEVTKQEKRGVWLFTYTDKDGFVPKRELHKRTTTSVRDGFGELSNLAESIVRLPGRGGGDVDGGRGSERDSAASASSAASSLSWPSRRAASASAASHGTTPSTVTAAAMRPTMPRCVAAFEPCSISTSSSAWLPASSFLPM